VEILAIFTILKIFWKIIS